jgi:hypothetical protein
MAAEWLGDHLGLEIGEIDQPNVPRYRAARWVASAPGIEAPPPAPAPAMPATPSKRGQLGLALDRAPASSDACGECGERREIHPSPLITCGNFIEGRITRRSPSSSSDARTAEK